MRPRPPSLFPLSLQPRLSRRVLLGGFPGSWCGVGSWLRNSLRQAGMKQAGGPPLSLQLRGCPKGTNPSLGVRAAPPPTPQPLLGLRSGSRGQGVPVAPGHSRPGPARQPPLPTSWAGISGDTCLSPSPGPPTLTASSPHTPHTCGEVPPPGWQGSLASSASSGAKVERGKELGHARPRLPSQTRRARCVCGHPPVEAWPWRASPAICRVRGPRHGVAEFHSESHHTLGTSGTGDPWATPLHEGKPNCERGCQQAAGPVVIATFLPSLGSPGPGVSRLMEAQPTLRGFPRMWWFPQQTWESFGDR